MNPSFSCIIFERKSYKFFGVILCGGKELFGLDTCQLLYLIQRPKIVLPKEILVLAFLKDTERCLGRVVNMHNVAHIDEFWY